MKINKELEDIINEQINHEFQSFYNYLAIAAWFETTPYAGFASWMKMQGQEEQQHAMKFFDYLVDRGGEVKLLPLSQPKVQFESCLDAFRTSLEQEQRVTKLIHKIYEAADTHKDYETRHFLSWFLQEQTEEEKTVEDFIIKLELVKDDPSGLLQLDAEAGSRPEPAEE